jgi:hypothetical protein
VPPTGVSRLQSGGRQLAQSGDELGCAVPRYRYRGTAQLPPGNSADQIDVSTTKRAESNLDSVSSQPPETPACRRFAWMNASRERPRKATALVGQ